MNKVLSTVGGLMTVGGFFLMIGVAGAQDFAIEVGEYLPWYYGWQQAIVSVLLMVLGMFILKFTDYEEYEYED